MNARRYTPERPGEFRGERLHMARARKTWREKLENPVAGLPKVCEVPDKWVKTMGGRQILVPTPRMVDDYVRTVPKRKLVTVGQIRRTLAGPFKADSTCPMTTGIFLRIISEAAEEDRQAGVKTITPYWRVIKDDGSLNAKFPGGVEGHAAKLREEGHDILPGVGKKPPKVVNFKESLV
ncbi:MAG: hypothetical protein ABFE01_26330 [Phycisphaerales bacterium]